MNQSRLDTFFTLNRNADNYFDNFTSELFLLNFHIGYTSDLFSPHALSRKLDRHTSESDQTKKVKGKKRGKNSVNKMKRSSQRKKTQ